MKERSSLKVLAMASSTSRPACISEDGSLGCVYGHHYRDDLSADTVTRYQTYS